MSSTEFDFNIDDILAEFYAQERAQAAARPPQEVPVPVPAPVAPPAEQPPVWAEPPGLRAPEPPPQLVPEPEPLQSQPALEVELEFDPEEQEEEEDPRRPSLFIRILRGFFGLVFAAAGLFVLGWMLVNVHPDSGPVSAASRTQLNLLSKLDTYANNAASDALSELTYIRKIYTIPENATSAPAPNPANYGSTDDPQVIMDLINSASILLDGQEMAFDPNADFQSGKSIRYYYDETILAIAWKEIINGKCCSFAEVKVADGSQLRRKLAGDSYGSSVQLYASDMAKAANAVVAMNGDFYAFRPIGITAYQRQIYRCNSPTLDTCFFTASGDMLFSYAGEHTDWDETQQFVDDNDVLFGVTFGPVLVDNGELRSISRYPIGEVDRTYSRSAIGMLGQLHYLCMTINYDAGYSTAATLQQEAQIIYDKGCIKAYALDGGQTSILLMGGEWVNHVDWGNERTMSDIIYFATALPEETA